MYVYTVCCLHFLISEQQKFPLRFLQNYASICLFSKISWVYKRVTRAKSKVSTVKGVSSKWKFEARNIFSDNEGSENGNNYFKTEGLCDEKNFTCSYGNIKRKVSKFFLNVCLCLTEVYFIDAKWFLIIANIQCPGKYYWSKSKRLTHCIALSQIKLMKNCWGMVSICNFCVSLKLLLCFYS